MREFLEINRLAATAYFISLVGINGFFTMPVASPYFWIAICFVGGILLAVKNKYFDTPRERLKIFKYDILFLGTQFVLGVAIPAYMGLVKQFIMALVATYSMRYILLKFFAKKPSS